MNLYSGSAAGGAVALGGGGTLVVPNAEDGHVLVALRPSALTVYAEEPHASSARNIWSATITAFAPLGDRIRSTAPGEQNIFVDLTASAVAEPGLIRGRRVWTREGDRPRLLSGARGTLSSVPDITVRFWAGAQRAAGHAAEPLCAATVGELRELLAGRDELAKVCAVASFLVDGQRAGDSTRLEPGSVVDVLPPFAGG